MFESTLIISIGRFFIFSIAAVFGVFLYYRSGKYEFIDDDVLFDSVFVGIVGAMLSGRFVDFLIRFDFYNWSFKKLFFFNVFSGFDWYGAFLGAAIFLILFLRKRKENVWFIFDIFSAPLVFTAIIISLGNFTLNQDKVSLLYAGGFLIIFWILKRLSKTKRHRGFLFSIALVSISILNLSLFKLTTSKPFIINSYNYFLVIPALSLSIGILLLYFLGKRHISKDFKLIEALLLHGLLRLKKILTSKQEANLASKAIIFLPLPLSKSALNLVKLLGREIQASMTEFFQIVGIKK